MKWNQQLLKLSNFLNFSCTSFVFTCHFAWKETSTEAERSVSYGKFDITYRRNKAEEILKKNEGFMKSLIHQSYKTV